MYKANTKPRKSTDYLVVHCSATTEKMNIGAKEIDRWHREKGYKCIGYHYVIRRDGTLEIGRPEHEIGAHVQGFNDRSIGICLVGGVDADNPKAAENNFTLDQMNALAALLENLKKRYPDARIVGHRDLPGVKKACPSFDVSEWLQETTNLSYVKVTRAD